MSKVFPSLNFLEHSWQAEKEKLTNFQCERILCDNKKKSCCRERIGTMRIL